MHIIWMTETHLSPLLLAMPMSFSMPPASRSALAFSMFLVMTSCRAQQMAVTVSSDMVLLVALLVELPLALLLPGRRWTRSLIAYFPTRSEKIREEKEEEECQDFAEFCSRIIQKCQCKL